MDALKQFANWTSNWSGPMAALSGSVVYANKFLQFLSDHSALIGIFCAVGTFAVYLISTAIERYIDIKEYRRSKKRD